MKKQSTFYSKQQQQRNIKLLNINLPHLSIKTSLLHNPEEYQHRQLETVIKTKHYKGNVLLTIKHATLTGGLYNWTKLSLDLTKVKRNTSDISKAEWDYSRLPTT